MDHIDVDLRDRAKAASLDQNRPLRRTSEGCSTSPVGPNIAAPLRPSCTSFKLITRLSTWRNSMPEKLNHVDFDAFRGEVVEQRFEQHLRL